MDTTPFLESMLAAGIQQCAAAVDGSEGLLVALFAAGFAGGFTHCLGMCGPFVMSQVQARLEAVPANAMGELQRLKGGALVPYHIGRATTYATLGAVGALATRQLAQLPWLAHLAAVLLAGAGVFFIGYALRSLGLRLPRAAAAGEGRWARAWGRVIHPLFVHPTGWRGYVLGVALGFLPCGLVYGALAAASAGGLALTGAFAMIAFWAGTVPALLVLGVAGGAVLGRWPAIAKKLAPVLLLVNGGFLLTLAVGML